jgi:hypothetical protein
MKTESVDYVNAEDLSEEFFPMQLSDEWDFVDAVNMTELLVVYEVIGDFSKGVVRVQLNNKYGFIDKTGREIVPCKYYKVLADSNIYFYIFDC